MNRSSPLTDRQVAVVDPAAMRSSSGAGHQTTGEIDPREYHENGYAPHLQFEPPDIAKNVYVRQPLLLDSPNVADIKAENVRRPKKNARRDWQRYRARRERRKNDAKVSSLTVLGPLTDKGDRSKSVADQSDFMKVINSVAQMYR